GSRVVIGRTCRYVTSGRQEGARAIWMVDFPMSRVKAPPTSQLRPLSLHAALPISRIVRTRSPVPAPNGTQKPIAEPSSTSASSSDRKSTRLNSSHVPISYAVFCLEKKNQHQKGRGTTSVRKALACASDAPDIHSTL